MQTIIVAGLLLAALAAGCGGGAKDLLDTAKLEELQNNKPHARQLYEQVVREHPGTPQAHEAEARLQALARE